MRVRIVLASADFGLELTTVVLWLRETYGLDVRCVRLQPYRADGRVFIDAQSIIPLPEAEQYQVRVREKEQEERAARTPDRTLDEAWRAIETSRPPEEVAAARAVEAWLGPRVTSFFPTSDGVAPYLATGGVNQYFFKITTRGDVELWLHYLARKAPFSDLALRHDLVARLNEIPGITPIPPDREAGRPRFPLALLTTAEAMTRFRTAWLWAIERMVPPPVVEARYRSGDYRRFASNAAPAA